MTLQIRSTYFDFFEYTYGHINTEWYPSASIAWPAFYFIQQIKNHGRPVQNLMNKALLMSALYSSTQPSLLPRSAVVWSWTCWWKQKSSYHWNVLHCQDLKPLPLITKAKRPWHESDTAKTSHWIFSRIELDCATTSDKACWGTSQKSFFPLSKILFFPSRPTKNGNRRQMNARFLPPPTLPLYPMLFRITRKLLGFRTKQLWIEGGEGAYFFFLERMVVWRKS